ncbi:MlaA family lipoprotein [Vibrio mangrovi]|uniref:MlaA family lipoprotein n=1 Tax=Vibrio mangrovi TaxID=474394 RepID=A0A1Y6IUP3_9VIBR|nr:MlaA family lipoprotein [Vibrio mangrovi]MDW6001438.1 MlaA family lipoprotein [Vibrio mangrovi]SMS00540.1 putative phospholipid-binding lipoprotein MlaA precursor [Vibrio mangrovi]
MNYRIKRLCFGFLMLVLVGCSSTPGENADEQDLSSTNSSVNDPFEGVNRSFWSLNYDYLDPYVIKPVSLAYVDHVPSPIRRAIANFFSNLDEPASMVNNLIMGNGHKALDHFNRFWMNSTFGLFGLIDIASEAGITKEGHKGFGDALGHYGVGNGPYLMVPAAGPYTPRAATNLVDEAYAPLSYLNIWGSVSKFIFEGMETRASLASQESMLENSPDPYALARDIYLQHQDFKAEIEEKDAYDPDQEALFDEYLNE